MHTCGYRVPRAGGGDLLTDDYSGDGRCSYCGSVSQEAFLAFVEAGGEVTPTDKGYKVYLRSVDGGVPAPGIKFYFYHLDSFGRGEFVRLYNTLAMRVGMPGYFYVMPFFLQQQDLKK